MAAPKTRASHGICSRSRRPRASRGRRGTPHARRNRRRTQRTWRQKLSHDDANATTMTPGRTSGQLFVPHS